MTLPAEGPTTLDLVKLQLSLTGSSDDAYVTTVVDAANDLVRSLPIVARLEAAADGGDLEAWSERVVLGATMLAARLVRRRNSPSGVEAMTDAGVAYVARSDPDTAQLLQLGAFRVPAVG
jgi:hypothetical protein